jgi:hypothetical protein
MIMKSEEGAEGSIDSSTQDSNGAFVLEFMSP